jgi:hypothetical protein
MTLDRYDKADFVAVIGMGAAALDMEGYIASAPEWFAESGIALAALAIMSNLYHKHKTSIVTKIDETRHKVFHSTHKDGDEEIIEDVLDAVEEVIDDLN